MLHTDVIAKLAAKTHEPNFRPWNIDAHGHAHKIGIAKGKVIYSLRYVHAPETEYIINGDELNVIGRFI
jgi:hypothetical protein